MRFLLSFFLTLLLALPSFGAAAGTPQNCNIGGQVVFGAQNQYPDILFQYQEPSTTTVQFKGSTTVAIPANSTNNQINTATLFPGWNTPVTIGIAEVTNPSLQVNVGLSSTDPRIQIAPGGFILIRTQAGFPVFFVDNPSSSSIALVQVFGMSN